jgi:hypothetical protein
MAVPFRPAHVVLGLVLALGNAGCVSVESRPAVAAPLPATATSVCDRLYFGRAIPSGGEVTEAQWTAFVAAEIAPRFPNGFTTYHAAGHWRGDDGVTVNEPTMILEVVHSADTTSDRALEAIARTYRERFNQDAVMRVRLTADQVFLRR